MSHSSSTYVTKCQPLRRQIRQWLAGGVSMLHNPFPCPKWNLICPRKYSINPFLSEWDDCSYFYSQRSGNILVPVRMGNKEPGHFKARDFIYLFIYFCNRNMSLLNNRLWGMSWPQFLKWTPLPNLSASFRVWVKLTKILDYLRLNILSAFTKVKIK